MPSNLVLSARLAESGSTMPAWMIAAEAEKAAEVYLTGGKPLGDVCGTCFTTKAVVTGECLCGDE